MIRRNVEYVITCDSERLGMPDGCHSYGAHAFCDLTAEGCAESAKKNGWVQASKRLWLCPECAKIAERKRAEVGHLTAVHQ